MTKALDLLEAVDSILDSPEKWTKLQLARDKDGNTTAASSDDAACFCLSGALVRACIGLRGAIGVMEDARQALRTAIRPNDDRDDPSIPLIPHFNDRPATTFEDVKRVIAVAIEAEKAKIEA